MGVPIAASAPSSIRTEVRVPGSYASYSITALSVSISARMSPGWTSSPGCLCQVAITPDSIVSDSRGIRISLIVLPLGADRPTADNVSRIAVAASSADGSAAVSRLFA